MTLCGEGQKPLRKKGKNMAKKEQNENRDEVLVIECKALSDEWETDADRNPLLIISEKEAKKYFWKYGYEIYAIRKYEGILTRVKEWWEE